MTHDATVQFSLTPAWEGEVDGEWLEVPPLVCWMSLCPVHRFFVPTTMGEEDLNHIPAESMGRYLEVHRDQAQYEFDHNGCGATVPPLTIP